ncbi:eukaryotic initiation factor 3, gamma subunit protein [Toxoplasma gondii]|uniref:tRNA (adenine(58)-N(1))-methyltransferase non-catalytic subunit TRM6 n=1 Tax=Toxoplasma gondii TaxID=5811 RepID=A0A7J6K7J6_TOXGO|nr:eukaryotic initiation factor 3, gamma subunit protein [Toxoplasma gondii]
MGRVVRERYVWVGERLTGHSNSFFWKRLRKKLSADTSEKACVALAQRHAALPVEEESPWHFLSRGTDLKRREQVPRGRDSPPNCLPPSTERSECFAYLVFPFLFNDKAFSVARHAPPRTVVFLAFCMQTRACTCRSNLKPTPPSRLSPPRNGRQGISILRNSDFSCHLSRQLFLSAFAFIRSSCAAPPLSHCRLLRFFHLFSTLLFPPRFGPFRAPFLPSFFSLTPRRVNLISKTLPENLDTQRLAECNPLFDEGTEDPSSPVEIAVPLKRRKLASSSRDLHPSELQTKTSRSPSPSPSFSPSSSSSSSSSSPSSSSASSALLPSAGGLVEEGMFVVLICSLGRRFVVRVPRCSETGDREEEENGDAVAAASRTSRRETERESRGSSSGAWSSSASPFDFPPSLLPGHAFFSSFLCCRGVWRLDDSPACVDELLAQAQRDGDSEEGGSREGKSPSAYRTAFDLHEEVEGDNRDIADSNDAQQLTAGKIECLREEGMRGEEVIRLLMANSSTFEKKTKFAQEKYIRKKMARHLKRVTVLPATLREVCEAYYATDAAKIAHLRMDYLSSVLINANIKCGDRVLVFDHSMGLLTGAVALQLSGVGRVWRLVDRGSSDKIEAELNLSPSVRRTIFNVPLANAESWPTKRRELLAASENRPTQASVLEAQVDASSPVNSSSAASLSPSSSSSSSASASPVLSSNRFFCEMEQMHSAGVDSVIYVLGLKKLIKATPADALSSLRQLAHRLLLLAFRLLKSGGRLVVFCHNWEIASALHAAAGASREFFHVQMQEFMLREQQILPRRTHPVMNSSLPLFSGFVVSAIRMQPDK